MAIFPEHYRGVRPGELAVAIPLAALSLWLAAKVLRALASYAFPSAIPGETNTLLLASIRPSTTSTQPATAKDVQDATAYDYIIVGGGTAGCVLAARLTEDPQNRVLVVESGHSDLKQLFSRIPAAFGRLFSTAADWDLKTVPEAGCNGRKLYWPRGKMLGGCSSINAMIYNQGSPSDYDEWASMGNDGWSYKDVKPFFKKAEGLSQKAAGKLRADELAQHGRNGPWKIGYSFTTELGGLMIDAFAAIGFPKVRDFNTSKGIQGSSYMQTFIDEKGQRSSTSTAYLTADVASRTNLKISVGQTVTRIIFDQSGSEPRAVGVELASGATTPVKYLARAKREVIVAAGAVHSPHVLKLSGIGPAEELAKHSIPLVKSLSGVGENLADHLYTSIITTVTKGTSLQYLVDPIASVPALLQWLRNGSGAMSTNVADVAAFCRTVDREDAPESLKNNDLSSGSDSADLELLGAAVAYIDHGRTVPKEKECFASIGPIHLRPQARGTITLASASPFHPPVITANYLDNQHDLDMLVYGTKLARQAFLSGPLKSSYKASYRPRNMNDMDDKAIEQFVRDTAETIYHPMGTAKMGPSSDSMAVVDDRLRVHGVKSLRVVDASVFPKPVACHPCAPVVMVAEKAASMIRNSQ